MNAQDFKHWREVMQLSQAKAANALGISQKNIENYERGRRLEDGRPVVIPRPIALACAALEAELGEWRGMAADNIKTAADAQAYVNWAFARFKRATERYNAGSAAAAKALPRAEAEYDNALAILKNF